MARLHARVLDVAEQAVHTRHDGSPHDLVRALDLLVVQAEVARRTRVLSGTDHDELLEAVRCMRDLAAR